MSETFCIRGPSISEDDDGRPEDEKTEEERRERRVRHIHWRRISGNSTINDNDDFQRRIGSLSSLDGHVTWHRVRDFRWILPRLSKISGWGLGTSKILPAAGVQLYKKCWLFAFWWINNRLHYKFWSLFKTILHIKFHEILNFYGFNCKLSLSLRYCCRRWLSR